MGTVKPMDYPLKGYSHGYGMNMNIIFIQWGGYGYHSICPREYPFTSLVRHL